MATLIIDEGFVKSYRALYCEVETPTDARITSAQRQRAPIEDCDEFVERVLSRVRDTVGDGYCSHGIRISGGQTEWRVDAFPPRWPALLYLTVWLFGTIFCFVVLWGPKAGGPFGYIVLTLFIALIQVLFVQAAFYVWGHYSVIMKGEKGVVFQGIASFGLKRGFDWAKVKCVRLTRAKNERGYIRKRIVLEADRNLRFGEFLNDYQRLLVASTLVVRNQGRRVDELDSREEIDGSAGTR